MELEKALSQISEIHAHVVRGELFRGYRSVPMAVTGLLAIAGAGLQEFAFQATDARGFALYWLAVAGVCGVVCAFDLWLQGRFLDSRTIRQRTLPVLAQYLPALVVGATVTWLLFDGPHAALLPGLWAIVHALGVFSSRPFLPRAVGWVTAFYLVAGVMLIRSAQAGEVLSPWAMGAAFGLGQACLAVVLHVNLERKPS